MVLRCCRAGCSLCRACCSPPVGSVLRLSQQGGRWLTVPPVLHPTRLFLSASPPRKGAGLLPLAHTGSQAPVPTAACAVTPAEWVWHRVGTRGSLRGSLDALTREEADTTQEDRAHPTKGLGLPGDPAAMPSPCAAGGGPSLAEHCASLSTCSSRVRAGCASPPCPCGH